MCHVCVCGVPWMDVMLWSVNDTTVQSQSVCTGVQYKCTHSRGHNIVMNRPRLLAWASTLHGSPTMTILWPAFFISSLSSMVLIYRLPESKDLFWRTKKLWNVPLPVLSDHFTTSCNPWPTGNRNYSCICNDMWQILKIFFCWGRESLKVCIVWIFIFVHIRIRLGT